MPNTFSISLIANCILVLVALLLGLIPIFLTARLKRRLPSMLKNKINESYNPLVSVILPCKGIDPGFSENILSILQQDYPKIELLFVVATNDDPAFVEIERMLDKHNAGHIQARLLVAGVGIERGQKLTNQLAAIRQISTQSEVFVFIDSDCRPDKGFVRRLIAPLAIPTTGATTGYRWYHPPKPTLGSMLRSTWNAGALPFLVDSETTHAWGGAMAIRREVFERAHLADVWNTAVSDDLTLTVAVRRLGLRLEFVPQCIAVSYEASSVRETLEFTNRQSLISRVYFPPLWWGTALGHATANLAMAYGCTSIILWVNGGDISTLVGGACLLLLPLQLANAAWLFNSVKDLLPLRIQINVLRLRWYYVVTAPLASMLTLYNTLHASTTRTITWRGITYELRSSSKTVVVRRDN